MGRRKKQSRKAPSQAQSLSPTQCPLNTSQARSRPDHIEAPSPPELQALEAQPARQLITRDQGMSAIPVARIDTPVPEGKTLVPLRPPSLDAPPEMMVQQLLYFGNAVSMVRSLRELPREFSETLKVMLTRLGAGQAILKSVELASLYDILKAYHLMTPLLQSEGGDLLAAHRKAVCALIVYLGVILSSDQFRTSNEVVCAYIGQLVSSMVTAGFFDDYSEGIQRITREVLERVFADIALLQPSAAKKECEKDKLEELYASLEESSLGGETFRQRVRATKDALAASRAKDSADQLNMMIEKMKAGEMPEEIEPGEDDNESLGTQCQQLQALVAQMQELGSSCHSSKQKSG